jgi:hypothetical protein
MRLRPLIVTLLILVAAMALAAWRDEARRARAGGSAFVDTALLEPADLERAHRIVVREKPQTKVVHKEEGFEIRRVVENDAPVRETVLRRDGASWVVASYFDLPADLEWVGQTMRDLSQGRLTRYLTSDPALMTDLELGLGVVRVEDAHGTVLRQLELGRKDGGDAYQFVRVDGKDAFVARHEAEILGDPLAWIVTRVLRFDAADVREMELPFQDPREPPLLLRRREKGAPLRPVLEPAADVDAARSRAAQVLEKLLAEPLLLAVARDHPGIAAAQRNVAARVRLALFDGRDYKVSYGMPAPGDPSFAGADVRPEDVIVLGVDASDPQDLARRYQDKAALVYSRPATLGRLPRNRAALTAPARPPADDGARPGGR